MQKYKLKNEKGITLVTLVVTVIILLILAGISIAGITGNNGITKRTADAKNSAEVKSEMNLVEVASNSARGKNKYGNINKTSLQKELDTSAGTNKTEVTEELDGNDKIGYKITFLDSKRYYFVYNEGEDTEIIFIGTVGKSTNSGIIHAIPRKGKVTVNTSETVEILLRVFSDIDNNNIDLSYGWSDSSYKEPDSYETVTVNGSGNDKTAEASYPTKTGKYYLYVKAKINNDEEISKVFGDYNVVSGEDAIGKYTVIYERGENVLKIGARHDTTTGEIKLPAITAENGFEATGWFENDEHVGDAGETININKNLTLTAKAKDSKAPTVRIAREDYNTFSWEAKDIGEITGYKITKSKTPPSADDNDWETNLANRTHDIDTASTYYVYVKDEKGNIGKASIDAYLVTRNQGTGTTLITRVDGTSNETGIQVTDNIAVLNNTKIYVEATALDGYKNVTINDGTKDVTNPSIITIQKNTIISSRAETAEIIVAFNANGGTGTMPNQTIAYGTATSLSANTFTKTGYTFTGWNTKADGTGTSYGDKAEITARENITLYAQWTTSTYTVEYYQGNNSTTAGSTKFATTSSHTFGTAKALTTYATLGGTAPSGWTFAGWSTSQTGTAVSTVNSVSLTDGASVTNLTNAANGTVKLYAIFKRDIVFKSGSNAGTTDATKEQRYNPYKTTGYLTSVTSPSALKSITGWTKTGTGTGYRNNATAGAATVALNAAVTPVYNETNLTYYGVYTKVINVYSGVNKGTNNKQTQYLNTNENKVSSISLAVPAEIENWTAIGYRDDTTVGDKETTVTTSAVSITPAYSTSAISYYAVYSRTLTIKYNGNSPTSGSTDSTTKTVYLNTNSTTTSSQQVTLANNGFIKNGYAFSKWAKGSTSGTQYSEGANYTAGLAYNASSFEVTMYAIWQDVYLRTSEASTDGTEAKFLYTTIERRKIKSITFADSIAGHTVDGTTCFDVSSISNLKQVLLWITNTDENGYVDIVIGQNGGVKANPNSYQLFSYVGYTPSTFTIDFTNFDTSSVTNMNNMFSYCGYTAMTSLDLGDNFDTSSVTTMYGMFYCCGKAMTNIDLGEKFDTSNVTDMHSMFASCGRTAMTSLDLGDKFDTSKVTNMWSMFSYCGYSAMTSLDLGDKFDTSKVTDMGSMFQYCGYTAMTSLDLGEKFDTSSVTKMNNMFQCCGYKAMTSLDLGDKFDTSSVTNMGSMFNSCGYTAMTGLDIGDNFNTSSVKNMSYMFASCGYNSMTSLNLGDKFDTSSVTNMSSMFSACGYKVMTSLDLGSKFDTSSVTNMQHMFNNCGHTAMTSLDLGDKFNTSSVTTMNGMFQDCGYSTMTSLDLGDKFDTSKVTDMSNMFGFCGYTAMTSLDLGDKFDTSSVTNMWAMFYNCGYTAMTNLDLGDKFNTSSVTNMEQMFENCGYTAMTSLDLGDKFDTSNVTDMYHMFYKCPNLVTIYATESFVTTNVTNGYDMFNLDFKLVGGMGTVYDNIHKDKEYAHLDLGTTNPGYFTDKRTYYVEFDANGGTGTMARQVMTYGESSNLTANTFTRAGYTFVGWNTKADGSGTSYTNGQSVLNLENGWKKVKTLYAQWSTSTYTVEYYQGNNSTTAGTTKFSTTSSHTYGTAKALTTYATLGGTAPSGWTFAGWSTSQTGTAVSTVNSVSLTDGASVTNLTNTANGTVKLYAIFKRDIVFKSGSNAGTTDATKEQRYNPYKTTGYITSVTSPSALTAITGWTATGTGTGYRNNATAGAATLALNTAVTPVYNETNLTYYGVYTKVINVYSGVSKGTNNKQTQYLNSNGNKVSSISLAVPVTIENWTAIGYRDDTTADDKETEVITSAVSITPAYSTSAISYYAVYSRTLKIKYNGNEATSGSTSSTTKTVYLNTNSTTTSSQQVTLANNGFIKNGYMFSKWAKGSTSGTKYAEGASYTAGLAYNASPFEVTMYAIWQKVTLRKSEEANSPMTEFLGTTLKRGNIKKISFTNSIAGHTVDGTTCFDVSSIVNSEQVLLWITNTDSNGYYDIVIGQNGGVIANPDSSYLFSFVGFQVITPFTMDLTGFNTAGVTNMSDMFNTCGYNAMTSLDLGDKFDTSSVTDMHRMFGGCGYTAMTSLDLGKKFDTSSVENMIDMFNNCGRTAMTSLDLGDNFNTSNVTNMTRMFHYCGYTAMTSLDLGDKFDTSSVTDMSQMFSSCGYTAMTSLYLGDNFNTSNVTNMRSMFSECGYTAMTSLDLGNKFDTSSVQNMETMFGYCGYKAMTSLDLGDKFDTSSVTDMGYMFNRCGYTVMTSLDLGDNFDTSKVTNMSNMFAHCGYTAMTSLDLGDKFDTSSVTNMSQMFSSCGYKTMTSLDLGGKFNTSSVQNMRTMFDSCGYIAMTSLDLGDKFDTSKVTNMANMFCYCGYTAMTSLDLGNKFDTSSVTNMLQMFSSCGYKAMTSLDLGDKFDTSRVTDMGNMFYYCGYTAMTSLDLGNKFDTSSVTNMFQMFRYCRVSSLDLGDRFDTSNVENMALMFNGCFNLTTIYATDSFVTTSVTKGYDMFTSDTKLVGGMGTAYDSNHIDQAYAHLDLGTTNPGYFTDKRTYYVEFDANGGTGTMARQTMTYGVSSNLTTNAFTKAGYTFAGWNDKADGSGTSYTNEQSVLNLENGWKKVKKLYAQWTANSYTIAFNNNTSYTTTGTMSSISTTYGSTVTLPANSFEVTQANVTSNQLFAKWNTKADGTGTNYEDGASVSNLTTEPNGTVTLYAQWTDANYEVSSPVKYTLDINDAISKANASATIKVLKTQTDNTAANIAKNLTLNLNGKTLTRNASINITAGNFTINGSADGQTTGTLYYNNTTDSSAIMNTGASSSVTIQSKTDLRSKAVGIRFGTGVTNGSLNIYNSYVHSEGAYSAIRIDKAKAVNISDSYIFSPYGYPATIYVDVVPTITISGKSRVGGGNLQDNNSSAARGVIVFSLAEQSTTTKLTLNGNAILMAGNYCKQAVLANRKINVDISGEAEVYSNNGPCFTHWVSGSIININTSGWVYANGSYVVAAGTNSIDVRLSRGTLVAQTQYMVYGGGTGKFKSQTNTHNHDFYVMNAYNSYSTKQFSNLYEYGLGFVKVGQSSSYVWTYQDVTRKHGWNDIHGYRYYFWDSTKSNAEQHLAADDKTQYLDGQVVTKWLYVNGGWYYLTPSSTNADPVSSTHGRMHTEHLYLGTNHYFLAPSYNFTTYTDKELSGTYTFNYGQMVYGYLPNYGGPWWFDPADGVSR